MEIIPTTDTSDPVWCGGASWYDRHREAHEPFWEWLPTFIQNCDIASMLEVGGGYGQASELVERYCGIELNAAMVEEGRRRYPRHTFLCRDFTTIDAAPLVGRYDLVLACAVVEHCQSYKLLIQWAVGLKPRWIVVTMFGAHAKPADIITQKAADETQWSRQGKYWDNRYSLVRLGKWLGKLNGAKPWNRLLGSFGDDTVIMLEVA